LKIKKKYSYRRCKNCEVLKTSLFLNNEKESDREEYFSLLTSPESIIQEMDRLHNTFISVIKNQEKLIFWGEATKIYGQLLSKYHMELSTNNNPENFRFESSLLEEACNGMEEFGILKKTGKNQEN